MSQNDNGEERVIRIEHQRGTLIFRVMLGVGVVLVIIFLSMSQIFAWGRVRSLEQNYNNLEEITALNRSKSECLALYRNDVITALGLAVAANNKLFVALSARPPSLTDEERIANAAENARLGEELAESNAPLVAASNALIVYDKIDPPPEVCPHPNTSFPELDE